MLKIATASIISAIAILSAANEASALSLKKTNYPIPSGAYFVSPTNSPSSIAQIINAAPNGATIVFRGGTYRNIRLPLNKRLTLQAYPNQEVWLKGSIVVNNWVSEGNIWRKDSWNYSFPPNQQPQAIDPNYPMAGYRDMVYINGVPLNQVASKSRVAPGTFYLDARNNKLYIGSNPNGKTVEAAVQAEGIVMWNNSSGSVVRGLGLAHYADQGIRIGASNITVENNTLAWNGMEGVTVQSSNVKLRGNNISYNGRKGVGASYAHRLLLENNIVSYNNVERFSDSWSAAGVKILWTDGAIMRGNTVNNNQSIGLWIDESSTNSTVVNNVVRNNSSNGISMEISHKAIIASNVVVGNAPAGIIILNSSGARIYNNTLARNNANLLVAETSRNNTNSKEISQGITWITRNTVVKNNIFWNSSGSIFHAPSCAVKESSKLMIPITNNNAYYRTSASRSVNLTWGLNGNRCSQNFSSLASFRSATGLETNSLDVVSSQDPFFVNAQANDFRLKVGSPAIGRGELLPADIANAIGVSAGRKVNLGALN